MSPLSEASDEARNQGMAAIGVLRVKFDKNRGSVPDDHRQSC